MNSATMQLKTRDASPLHDATLSICPSGGYSSKTLNGELLQVRRLWRGSDSGASVAVHLIRHYERDRGLECVSPKRNSSVSKRASRSITIWIVLSRPWRPRGHAARVAPFETQRGQICRELQQCRHSGRKRFNSFEAAQYGKLPSRRASTKATTNRHDAQWV